MNKKKKKIDLTPYENREAFCKHFGKCGGCEYQRISYDRQLEMKKEHVRDLFCGVQNDKAEMTFEFEEIIPSPCEVAYRNKMEFSFGDEFKDGPLTLGLHQKGSFMNVIDITECHLVHNDLNIIRNAVRDFFAPLVEKGDIKFHNKKTHKGWLRHLLLRRGEKTGEILVALVTDSDINGGTDSKKTISDIDEKMILAGLKDALLELATKGNITGILHIINDSLSDVVKSDKTEILFGRDYIFDEILDLRFKISPFSFFQTNTNGAELLYKKVREYANDAKGTLFDLYSGTGTITQLMAKIAESVTGVEIVSEAVEAAFENAKMNDIDNVDFINGDVLKVIDSLDAPSFLILDPPREGVHPKVLGKILSWGVEQIVYVSCKPESFARELESFKIAGYEIKKACCVDMFPQTPNTECVILLSRAKDEARAPDFKMV